MVGVFWIQQFCVFNQYLHELLQCVVTKGAIFIANFIAEVDFSGAEIEFNSS